MQGAHIMSMKEANIALLSMIPESEQKEINDYLLKHCGKNSPFRPMSAEEIAAELTESRECYERGDYADFEEALDKISAKYGL